MPENSTLLELHMSLVMLSENPSAKRSSAAFSAGIPVLISAFWLVKSNNLMSRSSFHEVSAGVGPLSSTEVNSALISFCARISLVSIVIARHYRQVGLKISQGAFVLKIDDECGLQIQVDRRHAILALCFRRFVSGLRFFSERGVIVESATATGQQYQNDKGDGNGRHCASLPVLPSWWMLALHVIHSVLFDLAGANVCRCVLMQQSLCH